MEKSETRPGPPNVQPFPTASQGTPRYESATTQAPAVSAHVTTNSPHWKSLTAPANTRGTHTIRPNSPSCSVDSAAARRANTPNVTASPAAMNAAPVKYAHATCHGSQPGISTVVASRY